MTGKRSNKTYDLIELLDGFIKASASGRRLQKNGKRLRHGSIENYGYLKKLLLEFCINKNFELRIRPAGRMNKREFNAEKKYWKNFYRKFTDYLYNEKDYFDNYVGANIKMLRTFFGYLNDEKGINTGTFYKNFYVRKEDIQIITLLPEQLNFLIYDTEFEASLSPTLKKTKDIFVFGCTVALRFSDLMSISPSNLEVVNDEYYLKVVSGKTQTYTRIKLPGYAVDILKKYVRKKNKTLFPGISLFNLNKNIKSLVEKAGWTHTLIKTRQRRGIPIPVYKNAKVKEHYSVSDLVSSHTMRRTAITTMLCLGMPEHLVKKISGHSANSKSFNRYVEMAQLYVDQETEKVFEKLLSKKLFIKPELKENYAGEIA